MEILMLINAFANVVITLAMIAFIIFVFGRFSIMDKLPKYQMLTVRVGLCTTAAGSLFNFLTLSTPPLTEVMLNVGLAIVFLWAAIFHYNYFVKKK